MLWFYELKWCEIAIEDPEYLNGCVEEYKRFELSDFSNNDNGRKYKIGGEIETLTYQIEIMFN